MAVLSDSDRRNLEKNPNVLKVTGFNIAYTPTFKIKAVQQLSQGMSYQQIFAEAGIDLSLFGREYARKCLERWKKVVSTSGESGLKKERRGAKATGRPKGQKFKSLEEENAYLRAEVDFLKKLRALEAKLAKKKSSR
ncbi:transposase [Bdellovibrio bacteriovorus]|uniref:transposase n=1 Tax=Bdellovibrio bacteriovorus TaxID=959 RepID=UPI0035A8A6FB